MVLPVGRGGFQRLLPPSNGLGGMGGVCGQAVGRRWKVVGRGVGRLRSACRCCASGLSASNGGLVLVLSGFWALGVLEAVGGGVTITGATSTILVRILDGGPSETTSILPAANSRRMASARASAVTLGLDFLASGSLANKLGAYDGLDLSLTLRLCLVKRRRSVRKSWFASASRASCSKVPCPGSAT